MMIGVEARMPRVFREGDRVVIEVNEGAGSPVWYRFSLSKGDAESVVSQIAFGLELGVVAVGSVASKKCEVCGG